MKTTDLFKMAIQSQIAKMCSEDELFSERVNNNPDKNLNDCITYILNTVKASGCNGFTDEEIYGMAAHYYLEDKIDIGKPVNCKVVVNHTVELTAEEIADARKKAIDDLVQAEKNRLLKKNQPVKPTPPVQETQASLF